MAENAAQILHDHGKTRIVVPFLLGQHQIERHGRMHRRPAFDGTDSTHSFPTSKKRHSRGPVRNTRPAVTLA